MNNDNKIQQIAIQWLSNEINNIPNFVSVDAVKPLKKKNEEVKDADVDESSIKREPITKSDITAPPLCEIALFKYNALRGNKNGYWDKFPLVIIVRPFNDHFYGFNLHYLDHDTRTKIISVIKRFKRNGNAKDTFKFIYPFLDALVKLGTYNFAYKNYSYSALESKFVIIQPKYYDLVTQLPIAKLKENKQ